MVSGTLPNIVVTVPFCGAIFRVGNGLTNCGMALPGRGIWGLCAAQMFPIMASTATTAITEITENFSSLIITSFTDIFCKKHPLTIDIAHHLPSLKI